MDILNNIQRYIYTHLAYYGNMPYLVIGKFTLKSLADECVSEFRYDLDAPVEEKDKTILGCKFEEGDFLWGFYLKPFNEYSWNTLRCDDCELIIMDDDIQRSEDEFCDMFSGQITNE